MRWAMWPLATVLLISIRSWWLNEVPNLASSTDSLLIMASMVAASGVNQKPLEVYPDISTIRTPISASSHRPKTLDPKSHGWR